MCKYTRFHFLCGATKLKVSEPCPFAQTNYHDLVYCQLDPSAHVDDNTPRDYTADTYGPGICSNHNCRRTWCIPEDVPEDDSEYDMSRAACAEREDKWYRIVLSTEQQLDFFGLKFPLPFKHMSLHSQFWVYSDYFSQAEWTDWLVKACLTRPEQMDWKELNPRYMHSKLLWEVSRAGYLPAQVTDTRAEQKGTPARKATMGPFAMEKHVCGKKMLERGFCRVCGKWQRKGDKPEVVHGNDHSRWMAATDRSSEEMLKSATYLRQLDTIASVSYPHACEFLPFYCNAYPNAEGIPMQLSTDLAKDEQQEALRREVDELFADGDAMDLD